MVFLAAQFYHYMMSYLNFLSSATFWYVMNRVPPMPLTAMPESPGK